MDRFDDMRARVSGGGSPEGGGGGPFGVDVVVQASDNFNLGDAFVGTLKTGAKPQMGIVKLGLNAYNISADGNVALLYEGITSSSKTLKIYVNADNSSWSEIIVDLPDMTGASSRNTNDISYVQINEDGSRLVASMGAFLLSIEIDVNNKTAIARRIDIAEINLSEYGATSTKIENIGIRGNYLIYILNVKEGSSSYNYLMFSKLSNVITNVYRIKSSKQGDVGLGSAMSGVNAFGDNELLFLRGSYNNFYRVEISQEKVVACNENNSAGLQYITRNGLYGIINKVIYKINQETGTISTITTLTTSAYAINESCNYYIASNKLYRIEDKSGSNPVFSNYIYGAINGSYYDISNGKFFSSNYERNSILESEEAQYIIAHTISVSTAGDIYGVTTETMTMGETKKALKIFNK